MRAWKGRLKRFLRWDNPTARGWRHALRRLPKAYSRWNWAWRVDMGLRYEPLLSAIDSQGLGDARILDVGCGSRGGLASYLRRPTIATIGLDIHFRPEQVTAQRWMRPVQVSGTAIPLADGTFDLAVCLDTLEHLSAPERPQLLNELFRAVRDGGWVMVGAPWGMAARQYEEEINRLYRARTGRDHHMLSEHLEQELLTCEALEEAVRAAASRRFGDYQLRRQGNVNLELWRQLRMLLFLGRPLPGLGAVQRFLFRPLFPLLARRHHEPCYRQIFFVNHTERHG